MPLVCYFALKILSVVPKSLYIKKNVGIKSRRVTHIGPAHHSMSGVASIDDCYTKNSKRQKLLVSESVIETDR